MSGKYALIIGNTEYTDPGLAQLTAPGKDAEDFARVLNDKDIGAFDDVVTLLNQPEYVVREAIDDFFNLKMPEDLLVLYFSGHGVRDEFGALFLAVKNTFGNKLRATGIKSDFIREAMDHSRSRRQVLILDCCNSGAFSQGTKAATGVSIGTASAFEAGYGRIILTASDSTQFAWEGNKIIGETDNSLFTHFLVEGLEGSADRDGDGRITVDELYDYAYERVKLATPKQTPSKFSTRQQGEIVLRDNIRVEDTKPVPLPDDLSAAIQNSLPFVREGAVRQLDDLLKGRNLAMARTARQALEKMAEDDDSRSVARAAARALESVQQVEELAKQKERESKKELEDAQRKALEEAEVQRLLNERTVEAERLEKEKAEKYAVQKAEEHRAKINREVEQFLEVERRNAISSIDQRLAFLESAQKRAFIGATIGFTLWVFAELILTQVESWSWAFLLAGCALAGLIIYPHKVFLTLWGVSSLAWGFVGVATLGPGYSVAEIVFMFISLGIFYGLFTSGLISRVLYWLKVIS